MSGKPSSKASAEKWVIIDAEETNSANPIKQQLSREAENKDDKSTSDALTAEELRIQISNLRKLEKAEVATLAVTRKAINDLEHRLADLQKASQTTKPAHNGLSVFATGTAASAPQQPAGKPTQKKKKAGR